MKIEIVHISFGGPERIIVDKNGKRWKFEDHHYCGPIALNKKGDPLKKQPQENSPFWDAIDLWSAQGKRIANDSGEVRCVYESTF